MADLKISLSVPWRNVEKEAKMKLSGILKCMRKEVKCMEWLKFSYFEM